jgi:formylmethanofuran dehydrogenase subunit E
MLPPIPHAARLLALSIALAACERGGADTAPYASTGAPSAEPALHAVAAIHGGAGPWAVAGYRMGQFALARLGLPHGSFDLEIVHHTPREVQYSCIADGAAAATGASLGKLNLSLAEATAAETHTVYRRRSTGQAFAVRVTDAFRQRFADVPREKLAEAGREVVILRDEQIFLVSE